MIKLITAVIPVRAGSVRVKNKNIQLVGSYSLVERKIRQLKKSSYINNIVVGTNCQEAILIAKKMGVSVVERDNFFCDEKLASANDMIGDLSSKVDGDIILWSHCTNPFLYARHYDDAIEKFLSSENNGFDSLLSVQKIQSHMWSSEFKPVNYDPYLKTHTLAKDIAPVYFQDGGIFIQRRSKMIENSYFFGEKPKLFEVDFPYTHDINTKTDLDVAVALVNWLDAVESFV